MFSPSHAVVCRIWRAKSRWGLDTSMRIMNAMHTSTPYRRRMFEPEAAQKGVVVMARETKSAAIQGDLQRLSGTMELNKDLLPDLEPFRLKLTGIVTQTFDLSKQQAAMKASKQESSKQLRKFLKDGQ